MLRAGLVAACTVPAGCLTKGDRETSANQTPVNSGTETTTSQGTTPPHPDCERSTPRSGVRIVNDATERLAVTFAVETAGETAFKDTTEVRPGEPAHYSSALPESGTYRITAELADGTSNSREWTAVGTDERALVTITVTGDRRIELERDRFAAESTPTPCPQ